MYTPGDSQQQLSCDTILSLSESCLLSNPVGKTTKMSSSKKVILQMYSIYFSFEDMTSVKIWRDEIKAAENLLFTPAVVKNGFVFEIAPEVGYVITYRHSG